MARFQQVPLRVPLKLGMFLILTGTLGLGGCKKKNSTDGGLLDEPPQSDTTSAQLTTAGSSKSEGPVGEWKLQCQPLEDPKDPRIYTIELSGALSETDENQPIKISISKSERTPSSPPSSPPGSPGSPGSPAQNATSRMIASMEPGRGAIAPEGNLFMGFAGGALTGQYLPSTKKYEALLTLVQDEDVSGLGVTCEVLQRRP